MAGCLLFTISGWQEGGLATVKALWVVFDKRKLENYDAGWV